MRHDRHALPLALALLGLGLGLGLGCAGEPASSSAPPPAAYHCHEVAGSHHVFATTACPASLPDDPSLSCGTLQLAEDPDADRSCLVELAWVRYTPRELTDDVPIFVLGGGPGQAMVERTADVVALAEQVAPGRSFILHDPRGVGASTPRLDCSQVRSRGMDPTSALTECARTYREGGHDSSRYRTETLADDLDALAGAFGFDTVDLFGASYGSRLAYAYASLYPDRTRALVLDAATPLDAPLLERVVANYLQATSRIFADCAASPSCSDRHGDVAAAHADNLARLDRDPPSLALDDARLPLSAQRYVALTGQLAARAPAALPAFVRAVASGEYAPAEERLRASEGSPLALFMNLAITCSEELPQNDRARAREDLAGFPAYSPISLYDQVAAQCEALGLCPEPGAAPAWKGRVEPLPESLPVLALNGRYDPLSIAASWTDADLSLPARNRFEIPDAGHPARSSACGAELVARFLAHPANDLQLPADCVPSADFFVETLDGD